MEIFSILLKVVIFVMGLIAFLHSFGVFRRQIRWYSLTFFYTSLSNCLVLVYYGIVLLFRRGNAFGEPLSYGVTMGIFLTFLIYHFILSPNDRRRGREEGRPRIFLNYENIVMHYVVPVLTMLDYLVFSSKDGLTLLNSITWVLLPLCYVTYILLRASSLRKKQRWDIPHYPYPFLDIEKYGVRKIGFTVLGMVIFFLLLGVFFGWLCITFLI